MKKIVVFGSINTDLTISSPYLPVSGETVKGYDFTISQGGKGANQAVAASLLGADVEMIGCLGNDDFGKQSLRALNKNKVGTSNVKMIANVPSAIAMIIRTIGDNRIILDCGANDFLSSDDLSTFLLGYEAEENIFITQLENRPEEIYKALKIAKNNKMYTIFNPAPAITLPESIYKDIDILIMNQSEAKIIAGIYPLIKEDVAMIYEKLKVQGLKNLIITLGVLGSVVVTEEKLEVIESVKVASIDTTGAGDAYIGALAYMLANDQNIFDACKFASIVSALSVTKKGAQSSMSTLEEVKKFMRSINYE